MNDARIPREQARVTTRAAGCNILRQAEPETEVGIDQAALALLALWVASQDEHEFGDLVQTAMTVTETDVEEVTQLAREGEFSQAARWLLG